MAAFTLTERQIRAIYNAVHIDTVGQDWRWPVASGEDPLSRDEMTDMRMRLLRFIEEPLPDHAIQVSATMREL